MHGYSGDEGVVFSFLLSVPRPETESQTEALGPGSAREGPWSCHCRPHSPVPCHFSAPLFDVIHPNNEFILAENKLQSCQI